MRGQESADCLTDLVHSSSSSPFITSEAEAAKDKLEAAFRPLLPLLLPASHPSFSSSQLTKQKDDEAIYEVATMEGEVEGEADDTASISSTLTAQSLPIYKQLPLPPHPLPHIPHHRLLALGELLFLLFLSLSFFSLHSPSLPRCPFCILISYNICILLPCG